jgi:predicted O-methyltransferase YrrM
MSPKTINLDDHLHAYLMRVSVREPAPFAALRQETQKLPESKMQTAPEQGQFMKLLATLVGARRAIEVGTFTGYGALWIASALAPDGRLITCDVTDEWVDIGRPFWQAAGVADKIDVRIRPAIETLDALLDQEGERGFDFAYIDADKENYIAYYERCLQLVRPGGLIACDNTLWSGQVADETVDDESTVALRQFNLHLADDERVDISLVPIGDGLTLARRVIKGDQG